MLHSLRSKNSFICINFPLIFHRFLFSQTRPLNTLSSPFSLCTTRRQLEQIHSRFFLHGLHQNPSLSSQLIDCYANLGFLDLSLLVFTSIIHPNSALYNVLLRNFSRYGDFETTFLFYREMTKNNLYPDEETYSSFLQSCSKFSFFENGKGVHGSLVKLGFGAFDVVTSALNDMYDKYDRELFEKMSARDLNCFSSLYYGDPQNGNPEENYMIRTLINLLEKVVDFDSLKLGKAVHCVVILSNYCENLYVNTAVLSMYTKLGHIEDARLIFDQMPERDLVVWNIIISAYAQNGKPEKCLELVKCMGRSWIRADFYTILPAISSITQLKCVKWGKEIHAHGVRTGSDHQISVCNSLIDMYCQCCKLDSARKIFDSLKNKTIISWSAMIKGYVSHDESQNSLVLFSEMVSSGTKADFITVLNILPACVTVGALEKVKYLHGYSVKLGLYSLSAINTALLLSYAKCGHIEMAQRLFDEEKVNDRDVIMWNSMINAHAKHGNWHLCFKLYRQMKKLNLKPDTHTFLGLLTACVNSGLVGEGKEFFKEMVEIYGYPPSKEHYASMVDLLGRAGHVEEARKLVRGMPIEPDARVWGPLLSASKLHSKTELAELAAKKLINMEPKNAGNYVLLSNIYAAAGKWDGVAKMRSFLKTEGLKKTPGCSWLEINGLVHEFRVADRTHPRFEDIYSILENIELEIKDIRRKKSEMA